jgi:putative tricarboxylic transport membrane protein
MRGIGEGDVGRRKLGKIGPLVGAALVFVLVLVVVGCNGAGGGAGGGEFPSDDVRIMVPADPGGGYDQLGRAVGQTLKEGGVVEENVEVYNVPGASGTTGLTQFVNENRGDPHQLMVMGSILVGAVKLTDAPVTLVEDTTPVAELSSEYVAIVVPADSEYENLEQLVEDLQANPGAVSWAGGSTGGVDQILVGQLAEEAGVDPREINYVPYDSGGEVITSVLSGDATAGVSGINEFIEQIDAGKLRALAVSSEEPVQGFDAPTLIEEGYDVSITNWRGVVAPPDLSEEDRQAVIGMIEEMHGTQEWKDFIETNNFEDTFKTGEEFGAFIRKEDQRISQVLQELGLTQ